MTSLLPNISSCASSASGASLLSQVQVSLACIAAFPGVWRREQAARRASVKAATVNIDTIEAAHAKLIADVLAWDAREAAAELAVPPAASWKTTSDCNPPPASHWFPCERRARRSKCRTTAAARNPFTAGATIIQCSGASSALKAILLAHSASLPPKEKAASKTADAAAPQPQPREARLAPPAPTAKKVARRVKLSKEISTIKDAESCQPGMFLSVFTLAAIIGIICFLWSILRCALRVARVEVANAVADGCHGVKEWASNLNSTGEAIFYHTHETHKAEKKDETHAEMMARVGAEVSAVLSQGWIPVSGVSAQ